MHLHLTTKLIEIDLDSAINYNSAANIKMKISDITRIKWVRDEEWPEKWYDSELYFYVLVKNNNPLASIFTKHGLSGLAVNNTLYSEEKGLYFWDKDREYAARNLHIISNLVAKSEKYIKKAEITINAIRRIKIIKQTDLKKIKKVFIFLWYIFLWDLGKPLAFEIEKMFKGKKLNSIQIEKIKDYLYTKYRSGFQKKDKHKYLSSELRNLLKKKDMQFLKLVQWCIFIDNYVADLYSKLDSLMTKHLCRRFSIKPEDIVLYSFTELEGLVKNKIKLKAEDLNRRKRFRIMVQINGQIAMFYGQDDFEKIKSTLPADIKIKTDTFPGIIASKGLKTGIVKIVKSVKDMIKVKKGDILVASTTRPELMLAIRRAAAIVTDTGGITSHAAIISREFKIPCIVGTEIATQVLKDGYLIEVNADKGIIKILKQTISR